MIDMALQERVIPNRNEWARKELTALKERILKGEHKEKGFTVFYNASCLLPIKEGIADRDKALQMLDEVSFFTNKFGIYVAGIARPDDITLEEERLMRFLRITACSCKLGTLVATIFH